MEDGGLTFPLCCRQAAMRKATLRLMFVNGVLITCL